MWDISWRFYELLIDNDYMFSYSLDTPLPLIDHVLQWLLADDQLYTRQRNIMADT